jgi:biotin transport system substrate-specific component
LHIVPTRLPARDLALIAVFAALIAALGLVPALQPFSGIAPITAQTLGVMLAGSILGARRGALAVLTFLVLVAAGLPLLTPSAVRPQGGLSVFTSLTAGFLLGWVLGAWVIGYFVERRPARWTRGWIVVANAVGGMGVIYLVGVPAMALIGKLPLGKALALSAVYLPGDVAKVLISALVTAAVLRGYPGVVPARSSREAELPR